MKRLTSKIMIIIAMTLSMSLQVQAQTDNAENDTNVQDRFTAVETDQGVLRIDKKTGDVSVCTKDQAVMTCRLVADDRQAYEAEIDRLEKQNKALREQLAALGEEPNATTTQDESSVLPSDEEMDRFIDAAGSLMKKFFESVEDMRKELEQQEQNLGEPAPQGNTF
jgi:predicted  nucleic acid-binding Zn-ribbon protein